MLTNLNEDMDFGKQRPLRASVMLLLVTAGLETRPRLMFVPNTSGKSAEIVRNSS